MHADGGVACHRRRQAPGRLSRRLGHAEIGVRQIRQPGQSSDGRAVKPLIVDPCNEMRQHPSLNGRPSRDRTNLLWRPFPVATAEVVSEIWPELSTTGSPGHVTAERFSVQMTVERRGPDKADANGAVAMGTAYQRRSQLTVRCSRHAESRLTRSPCSRSARRNQSVSSF